MAVNLKVQNQLHKAILHDSADEIRQAIKAGADANYTKGGKSPLIVAVLLNRVNAVQYLLRCRVYVDERVIIFSLKAGSRLCNTACNTTCNTRVNLETGRAKTPYLLIKSCGIDINTSFDCGQGQKKSLLQHSLELYDFETVLALIRDGADYSAIFSNGLNNLLQHCQSDLSYASLILDIVQELINNGYDINKIWSDDYTYIWGWENILKLLIKNGANPNYVFKKNQNDGFTYTPLFAAIQRGDKEVVKFLLDTGADINQKAMPYSYPVSVCQQTPLSYSIDNCYNAEIIELLIEHGANLE